MRSLIPVDHDPFAEEDGERPGVSPQDLPEPAPEPSPQRRGLIQNRDLDALFPEHERAVGPWKEGHGTVPVHPDYDDWLDMDMTKPGAGIHMTREQYQKAWDDAFDWVRSFSPEQRAKVDEYFRDHPETRPASYEDEDRALRLPARARYWYELSSRGMAAEAPNMPPRHITQFYNLVSGTSPQAEPWDNYRRALGAMSEHYQRLPIATDIIQPGLVRKLAFGPEDPDAPKTGNFAGTFDYIGGYRSRPTLSTNDRQVAKRLNINPEFLASNPWMYAGVSKFYQNYRDAENSANPDIRAGRDNPYETWQLQAPGWVDTRNQDLGAEGIERNDDYLHVQDRLKPMLEAAGIDTKPGLLSHEVLSQPNLPDLVSTSRPYYLRSPMMTLETATTRTPEGRRAADIFNQLPSGEDVAFARQARAKYEALQRRSMRELTNTAGGKRPSVIEDLASAALGQKVGMSRSDTRAWGTYRDEAGNEQISPNLRMPMWAVLKTNGPHGKGGDRITLPDDVTRLVLSAIGDAGYQEASAASRFRTLQPGELAPGAEAPTYSVFLHEHDRPQVDIDRIHELGRQLGAPLSISRGPNGTLVDIHPFAVQPLTNRGVIEAAGQVFPDVDHRVIGKEYSSYYMQHPEVLETPEARADPTKSYQAAHDAFWQQEPARAASWQPSDDVSRGVRTYYRDASRRASDFAAAKDAARAIFDAQRTRSAAWSDEYEPRLEAYRANPAAGGRVVRRRPAASDIAALAAAPGGPSTSAQFPQPPPGLVPGVSFPANPQPNGGL